MDRSQPILILGATGRTGTQLLKITLERGWKAQVLARRSDRIKLRPNLSVFEGSPMDEKDLVAAMKGCSSVLSCLNISRRSDFPWSGLRTDPKFLSDSMKKIIPIASALNVKRLIVLTAWGVNETQDEIPGWFRWLIDHSNIRFPYEDHGRMEKIIEQSGIPYTIIRPAGLTNSKKIKPPLVSFGGIPKPKLTISRRSVASFMLDILENDLHINEKPTISTG